MKHYTDTIPPTLAEKLKEKGMPMDCGCNLCCYPPYEVEEEYTYGFVFDWLMEKEFVITIRADYYLKGEIGGWIPHYNHWGLKRCDTWHEAANKAIEKALTLI